MDTGTVEQVAHDLLPIIRRPHFDPTSARDELTATVRPFVANVTELTDVFTRHGIKGDDAANRSRMIFYSPELVFLLSRFDTDFVLPIHNHDLWNFLLICSGEMHFRWYRRLDDRSAPGRAVIEVADDRTVRTGEIACIAPPPHDIHELAITQPGTWMLTVTTEQEPPLREVYDPAAEAYEIRPLAVADRAMA